MFQISDQLVVFVVSIEDDDHSADVHRGAQHFVFVFVIIIVFITTNTNK